MKLTGGIINKKIKVNYWIIIIIILGTFLRIYGLSFESFWLDEAGTSYVSQQSPSYIINNIYTKTKLVPEYFNQGGEMPLYFLLSYYWTNLFGLSEFKLRLLPVLFGIFSIYLIFLLGKEIFNKRIGLIAAFILAINHQHIYYSQEARMYSLMVLLAIFSAYFLLLSLKKNKIIYWAGYATSMVLLLYTHYYGFFILFFEYLYLMIFWKKYLRFIKQITVVSLAIFILYLPWMPALMRQILYSPDIGRIFGKPTILNLSYVFLSFNSWISPDLETRIALRDFSISQITSFGWVLIISILLLALLLFLLFAMGLLFNKDKITFENLKNSNHLFLLLWFLVPVSTSFIVSFIFSSSSIFGPARYLLYVSPAYYLIAAKGIFDAKKYKILFLILLIAFSIIPIYSYYANFDKPQYREAADYLLQNTKKNELIFIHKFNTILPFSYYYPDLDNVKTIENVDQLKASVKGKYSLWLLLSMEKFSDPEGAIKGYLDSNYKIDNSIEFTGVKIFHYVKI